MKVHVFSNSPSLAVAIYGLLQAAQHLTDPEEPNVRKYLAEEGCFNPPHSSHMGGVWEWMIGISRRILDSMLKQTSVSRLTHEVLSTLMAEVTAIINARPLIPISSDPESSFLLTPASLLTKKDVLTFLLQEPSTAKTSTANSGDKYNIWQTPFGTDGDTSIFQHCKAVASGRTCGLISRKGTWSCLRINRWSGMSGPWLWSWRHSLTKMEKSGRSNSRSQDLGQWRPFWGLSLRRSFSKVLRKWTKFSSPCYSDMFLLFR